MGKGYKVVVCGMASVGKTAILEQLLYGKHTVGLEEGATMEDVYLASVETDRGVKEQLRLYDTRGLQEGVELPKHYFSVADGFVLVYAVTSLEAFQRVELLKKEIDVFRDKKELSKHYSMTSPDLASKSHGPQRCCGTTLPPHSFPTEGTCSQGFSLPRRLHICLCAWEVGVTSEQKRFTSLLQPLTKELVMFLLFSSAEPFF
ncbi:NF-kappa-B inhibitor-interacting Ras-like protein 1 isoform X1 [Athene noctua]|uniref:NF-kappa-B inhibitor-interacting Ras-like protein 1 isoform X1 n=1 Tax=Athene noctua TaxID=126797 RepID=UPI003EB98612